MVISVVVKTGSKKGSLIQQNTPNEFTIFLHEKPHDGAANLALIKLLSNYFKVAKTHIIIKSGQRSHHKIIEIYD